MNASRFESALSAARKTYGFRTTAENLHTLRVSEFVAHVSMVIQAAQEDPEAMREAMRVVQVKPRKGQRGEMIALRVAAGDPHLRQPRWASAAAFVANPPDGDERPASYEDALDYMERRGGMKALSDLWSAHIRGVEPEVDATEAIDALLEGLRPDFDADAPDEYGLPGEGYVLALVKLGAKGGNGYILHGTDKQLIGLAKRIRQRGILEEGIAAYVERMRAGEDDRDDTYEEAAD